MKKIKIEIKGINAEVLVPDNCLHPVVYPRPVCQAVLKNKPECDCRWCSFHKEFGKANRISK